MTRTFSRCARIDYEGLLAKTMDIKHQQQWWTDNAKFNDAVGLAYMLRRLEREKSIALKFKLSMYEDERHAVIRKQNTTRVDTRKVDKYKKMRAKAKEVYDKKRIEKYRLVKKAKEAHEKKRIKAFQKAKKANVALGLYDGKESERTASDSDL